MIESPIKSEKSLISKSYKELLKEIKEKIKTSQIKAAISVNQELIQLYWEIGQSVQEKQKKEGWGGKTIEKLAKDLKSTFPDMKGFSLRNIQFMVQFAKEYLDAEIVKQLVSQIPWGHNIVLLQKLVTEKERLWYAQQTIENGWSRSVLLHWIERDLHKRQGKSINNFQDTLTDANSDLARQTLKDPYCFDFLTLRKKFDEKELEDGLLDHIQNFLLELGAGFSFVGRQVHLEVGNQDFYVDLLFYHLKLRCFVVIELKSTDFKPEYLGKMNFYLSVVDEMYKHKNDEPTIGLFLCRSNNKLVAEYALRDINKPLGITEYETKILESIPDDLKGSLPTIDEIEEEFGP